MFVGIGLILKGEEEQVRDKLRGGGSLNLKIKNKYKPIIVF